MLGETSTQHTTPYGRSSTACLLLRIGCARLDRGPRGHRVQDSRDGHSFDRAAQAKPAAGETTTAPDHARAADLHVFDLAVRDLSKNVGPMQREHHQPVLNEPHITPLASRNRRLRDVPAEVHQLRQGGHQGSGVFRECPYLS